MKKIYKLKSVLLLLTIFMLSCTDYLDLPPKNQTAVSKFDDIKLVFTGYLDKFTSYSNSGNIPVYYSLLPPEDLMMFESYSDNIDFTRSLGVYVNPGARMQSISPSSLIEPAYATWFLFNDFNSPAKVWDAYYASIGFLNTLIYEMDENVMDGLQADRDKVYGEMLAQRAFYFFKLLQYFAPMDNADLGIPVYLNSGRQVVGISLARKTQAVVYETILTDLNKALTLVNRTASEAGYNIFYNKRNLNNLLAQVYWYKATSPASKPSDWENAKIHASAAIEGTAELIPKTTDSYILIRRTGDKAYPAFRVSSYSTTAAKAIYGHQSYILADNLGWIIAPYHIKLKNEFVSLISENDIRKNFILMNGDELAKDFPRAVIVLLFQPEEAYLILAEAKYKLGDEAGAKATLNEFKSFRNSGNASGLSGNALYQGIQNERRLEFFGLMDHRWIDLKHFANTTHSRSLTFFGKNYNITVGPNDYRYALPIPFSELQKNPLMVQNPGWNIIVY